MIHDSLDRMVQRIRGSGNLHREGDSTAPDCETHLLGGILGSSFRPIGSQPVSKTGWQHDTGNFAKDLLRSFGNVLV